MIDGIQEVIDPNYEADDVIKEIVEAFVGTPFYFYLMKKIVRQRVALAVVMDDLSHIDDALKLEEKEPDSFSSLGPLHDAVSRFATMTVQLNFLPMD